MKKQFILLISLAIFLVSVLIYKHRQDQQFKIDFRQSIQAVPEQLRRNSNILPAQIANFVKMDIVVVYPIIYYYIDIKSYKEKKLPEDVLDDFKEQPDIICKSFFTEVRPHILRGTKHQQKLFVELLKTENLSVQIKLRNAYGEVLYTESAVLAQCPEYSSLLYNLTSVG